MTSTTASTPPTELDVFRRIVDDDEATLSIDAAEALLRLKFCPQDRRRMNHLAERNRQGRLTTSEEQELESFIRAGQLLGILQSKARQALKTHGSPCEGE